MQPKIKQVQKKINTQVMLVETMARERAMEAYYGQRVLDLAQENFELRQTIELLNAEVKKLKDGGADGSA